MPEHRGGRPASQAGSLEGLEHGYLGEEEDRDKEVQEEEDGSEGEHDDVCDTQALACLLIVPLSNLLSDYDQGQHTNLPNHKDGQNDLPHPLVLLHPELKLLVIPSLQLLREDTHVHYEEVEDQESDPLTNGCCHLRYIVVG